MQRLALYLHECIHAYIFPVWINPRYAQTAACLPLTLHKTTLIRDHSPLRLHSAELRGILCIEVPPERWNTFLKRLCRVFAMVRDRVSADVTYGMDRSAKSMSVLFQFATYLKRH